MNLLQRLRTYLLKRSIKRYIQKHGTEGLVDLLIQQGWEILDQRTIKGDIKYVLTKNTAIITIRDANDTTKPQ